MRPGTEDLDLVDLLDRQHYRLAHWRLGNEELNYRRFFDVDALVAVRVEDDAVFDATHRLLLQLVRDGVVDGLRIDHPDGLADPSGYLRRVAVATGGAWVVVEKVLVGDESLCADWQCAGTTGYDALRRIGALFVDPAGAPALRAAFTGLAGAEQGWDDVVERARRDVLGTLLVAEVERLVRVAQQVCHGDVRLRDSSRRGLSEAITELLVAVPVYRAYVVPGVEADAEAEGILSAAAARAVQRRPDRAAEVALVRDLALGRLGRGPAKDEFCLRFQQTTGPAIAKGVEDTAAYRWHPLAALCEVGGEPDEFGLAGEQFHRWAERRRASWPHALSATSTHDTKRSEDVRARLAVLSEIPHEWLTAVRAWQARLGTVGAATEAAVGVDERLEWLAWQTLVGAWPIDAERLAGYLRKAAREARLHTSWSWPNDAYEAAVAGFVAQVCADDAVLGEVGRFVERLHAGFVANVLGQRLVQLAAVGVPDIYQGCEVVNLRLVDPDNRSPVAHAAVTAALARGLAGAPDPYTDLDAAKARLTATGLRLRRDRPALLGGRRTAGRAPRVRVGSGPRPRVPARRRRGRGRDAVRAPARRCRGLAGHPARAAAGSLEPAADRWSAHCRPRWDSPWGRARGLARRPARTQPVAATRWSPPPVVEPPLAGRACRDPLRVRDGRSAGGGSGGGDRGHLRQLADGRSRQSSTSGGARGPPDCADRA